MRYELRRSAPSAPSFDLDADLNPEQRAVVTAPVGRLLVLAGAGTGKTRTLTYRVARLIAAGCSPSRILLVTFTNRAAREMIGRVEALLAIETRQAFAGTFHHVGHRLLRRHAERIGLAPDFGILDPEDARDLLAGVVAQLGLDTLTQRRFPSPKLLAQMISLAADTDASLPAVIAERFARFAELTPALVQIAARYAERKRALNLVDFDDLLAHWCLALTDPAHAAVGAELRASFDHVLVDEYQDINPIQGRLVDEMSRAHGSLTCVGDDAQSIYGFRGADFALIHEFRARHPDAQILPLTTNYRSTPQILELANASIAHNRRGYPKVLRAVRGAGPLPALIPLRDVYQQAELIAQRVLELHHDRNLPLAKMAVLYRAHAHSLELQVELTRRKIPYAVRSGQRFFEQAHVKDVVSFLRARENPKDSIAWVRLLRQFPGVGQRSAEAIAMTIASLDALDPRAPRPIDILKTAVGSTPKRAQPGLSRLLALWGELCEPGLRAPAAALRRILAGHYAELLERTYLNAPQRAEDIENLAGFAARYDDPRGFLDELALVSGAGGEQVISGDEPDDRLILTTVHQAKGLEWPVCFVIGLAEGRFPSGPALKRERELEEERRLFYVAVTRAADELYLCYPTVEAGVDGPARLLRPSRFLLELDTQPPRFERWVIDEVPLEGE